MYVVKIVRYIRSQGVGRWAPVATLHSVCPQLFSYRSVFTCCCFRFWCWGRGADNGEVDVPPWLRQLLCTGWGLGRHHRIQHGRPRSCVSNSSHVMSDLTMIYPVHFTQPFDHLDSVPLENIGHLCVPLGTTGCHWAHWVPLGITGYYWVPLGTTGHHWVPLGTTGCHWAHWVTLGTTVYYWAPLGTTG